MKIVSTELYEAIHKRSRQFKLKLVFDNFEIINVENYKTETLSSSSTGLTFGTVAIGNGSFIISKNSHDIINEPFRAYIGVKVGDSFEWVKLGKYTVKNTEKQGKKDKVVFEDDISLLDKKFSIALQVPASALSVLSEIENLCGVVFDKSNIPSDLMIQKQISQYSCRDIVGFIAQLVGCFAVVDGESEKIAFKWFENTGYVINKENHLYMIKEPVVDAHFELGAISCQAETEILTASVENTTGVIALTNPLMTQAVLDDLLQTRKGFAYDGGSAQFVLGNPLLDVWDIVIIEYLDKTSVFPCMSVSFTFNGGFTCDIKSFIRNENTAFEGTTTKEINDAKTQITVLAGKVESKVERDELISEINQQAAKVKIAAKSVDLEGAVSFSSFNKETQERFESAENNTDIVSSQSGSSLHITDSAEANLIGYKLLGKSVQSGTPTPEAPIEIESVGDDGSVETTITNEDNTLSQTYTHSLPEALRSIGDVYDEIDFAREKYIKRINKVVLNGTEVFTRVGTKQFGFNITDCIKTASTVLDAICSHFDYRTDSFGTQTTGFVKHNYYVYFRFSNLAEDNVTAWKSFLAKQYANGTPVEIQYILAEPIEYDLTDEEIAKFRSMHTYKGVTNIFTDDIGEISAEYVRNTALGKQFVEAVSKLDTAITADWCYENDKTLIDGGKIYTRSIKAKQIDVNNLFAQKITSPVNDNYYIDLTNGTITASSLNAPSGTANIRFSGSEMLFGQDDLVLSDARGAKIWFVPSAFDYEADVYPYPYLSEPRIILSAKDENTEKQMTGHIRATPNFFRLRYESGENDLWYTNVDIYEKEVRFSSDVKIAGDLYVQGLSILEQIKDALGVTLYESDTWYGKYCDSSINPTSVNSVLLSDPTHKYKTIKVFTRFPYALGSMDFPLDKNTAMSDATFGQYTGGIFLPAMDNTNGGTLNRFYKMNWRVTKQEGVGWLFQVIEAGWIGLGLEAADYSQDSSHEIAPNTAEWNQRHNNNAYSVYKIVGYTI